MGRGEGGGGRSLPGEVTLGPIGAKDDHRTAVAVAVSPGFVLPCITNIKDADRPHEIELRSADVDVCTILNEAQGKIHGDELIQGLVHAQYGRFCHCLRCVKGRGE
jgi:hypothetical protein